MDEGDRKRQLIDGRTEGTGRLRDGVDRAPVSAGATPSRGAGRPAAAWGRTSTARPRPGIDGARAVIEDGVWFLRRRIAWPVQDAFERLGSRGAIGVFGGGGIAVAGVAAALLIASAGGSGPSAGTTAAFVTPQRPPAPVAAAPAPAPKPAKQKVAKPTGPTLHGAPPDFSPAQDVRAGVGNRRAVGGEHGGGHGAAHRGSAGHAGAEDESVASVATTGGVKPGRAAGARDTPASTAKIGATPAASASAQAQASSLATRGNRGVAGTAAGQADDAGAAAPGDGAGGEELTGPPAPKAAKKVARRFAEAFVVYEIGDLDAKVREAFHKTSTKQLSRSLLHRPPRQPARVEVPRAKVVNVVAGPSRGSVYTVSVSLLRVGVTSELRLEMERGVGKQWQVTNVLG